MLAGRSRLLLAFAALSIVPVACNAPVDSAKKPLPVCDAKDPECPGVPASSSNKAHSDVPTDPVQVPDPTPTPAPTPATSPEAGVDAAPVVGTECTGLGACCQQLKDAGYDTTICKSILSTNNEDACYDKHKSYKDSGDCT